jgi:hypothetical protein
MRRILFFAIPAAALSLALLPGQPESAPRLTADMVREITLRNIPGTFSSGRISDVAIDPRNRNIWYVATSSGGLWKTTNRGIAFQPIFDDGGSYSLGCVAVDPRNSDVVWLGTGENQSQRAIGWGDGIYKSLDAGKTWRNVGLKNSEHIAKILVDPRDRCSHRAATAASIKLPTAARPGSPSCRSPRTPASPISISIRAIPT